MICLSANDGYAARDDLALVRVTSRPARKEFARLDVGS